jgi:hypothetical protein
MFKLQNKRLIIDIVDPIADKRLLGSRYCTGGYIFQVKDKVKGDLLAGPTFPEGGFNTFDGQGAPEVFVTALHEDTAQVGENVCVLGVGLVKRTSPKKPFHVRDNPEVVEFVSWDVDHASGSITMRCRHAFDKWHILLVRSVSLVRGTIVSHTTLFNNGNAPCPLKWFPHPFFSFPKHHVACRFGFPISIPDNAGYFLNSRGFLEMKPGCDWKKGLYQPLTVDQPATFSAELEHPLINKVTVMCDYVPSFLPVWANNRTFSFEPYLERLVKSGEEFSWKIEYLFSAD